MDRHVWEVAKARIIVSGGGVISVEEPKTKFCPIFFSSMRVDSKPWRVLESLWSGESRSLDCVLLEDSWRWRASALGSEPLNVWQRL